MSSQPSTIAVANDDPPAGPMLRSLMASDSPCVIVDHADTICQANAAFEQLLPASAGKSLLELFRFDTPPDADSFGPAEGLYYGRDGALVPAWLHTIHASPDTGERLLLVADGAPLRRAEMQRMNDAPLAVMRVCADGVVRYANHATYQALSLVPERVIGRTLFSLFDRSREDDPRTAEPEPGERCLKSVFDECLHTRKTVKLDISVAEYTQGERESAPMQLSPDLAPGGGVLGVIAVIEMTLVDRVREQIARIARDPSYTTWQSRLERVLEEVKRLIPFDHANFGMYAGDVSFFRAFLLYPRDHLRWTERWLPLPEGIKGWLERGLGSVPDVRQFIDAFPELRESQVVRMYEDRGMRSSATLVAKNQRGPTSALSLCSKQVGAFSEQHVELMRNLDLEPLLIRIEDQIRCQRTTLGDELRKQLADAPSLATEACAIVDALATSFRWDYVSLYRLDWQARLFRLFHQNACPEAFCIRPDYTQSFDIGMLGASLAQEKTLIINEVGKPGVEQYDYRAVGRDVVGSAMTIPLRLHDRIRWMLHIESEQAHVFHGPDKRAIEQIVGTLQEALKARVTSEVSRELSRETRQGMVVVGMDGAILSMNEAAQRLLAVKNGKWSHSFLKDYAWKGDPLGAEVFDGQGSTVLRRVVLLSENDRTRTVLATRRVLEGSFDTAIWFLINVQGRTWEVDMRFLRETVADVAQQTRAPLALASNLVRQLPKLCADVKPTGRHSPQKLSERLLAEIGKADITFERLAQGIDIRRYPKRTDKPVELARCVARVIEALPEREQKVIAWQTGSPAGQVSGDPERLEFVFRSLLAHLVRVRSDDGRVAIALAYENGTACLDFALTGVADTGDTHKADGRVKPRRDMMWRAFRQAREDSSLALEAIQRVIEEHGGSLVIEETPDADEAVAPPWLGFHIRLPELSGERS